MPCDCNKKTEADDMECPDGQSYAVSQGKCVAKESAFGDPKADSAIGDLASNGSDVGDKQQVEGCPEGHAINPDSGICEPNQATADKTDDIGQTNTSIATEKKLASIEKSLKALETRKPTAQVGLEDGEFSVTNQSNVYISDENESGSV